MTLVEKFAKAYQDSKKLTVKPSNEILLKMYSHYKQATVGDCNVNRPGVFDLVGQAKHDAWKSIEGLGRMEAMQVYVDLVKKCQVGESVSQ